jgi:hypothetical protein
VGQGENYCEGQQNHARSHPEDRRLYRERPNGAITDAELRR